MRKTIIVLGTLALFALALASSPMTSAIHTALPQRLSAAHSMPATRSEMELRPVSKPEVRFGTGEDTLHVDGPNNNNGIGLTNGGTFIGAIRLTPTKACTLAAAIFFDYQASEDGYVYIYGPGTQSQPGPVLDSEPYPGAGTGWKRVQLSQRIPLDSGVDFWVGVEVTNTAGTYPLGIDAGPAVATVGDWIYYQSTWQELRNSNLNYNWNIRAIIGHGAPPAHDVAAIAVLAPVGTIMPGPVTPHLQMKNMGTDSEKNIPVTCWIDSVGKRVYDETDTLAGPLAPGAGADMPFSPDWTAKLGTFHVTMFVKVAGDSNAGNDTAKATVTVVGSTWQKVAKPNSPDRIVQAVAYDPVHDMIYMIGGNAAGDSGTYVNSCQQYNPATSAWTDKAVMPTARGWITASYVKGKICVIGGNDNSNALLANNEAYDINGNSWSTLAPRPRALMAALAGTWNDSLVFVMGGTDLTSGYANVDIYDPANNAWTTGTPLPQPADMGSAVIVGDTIYIAEALNRSTPGCWTNLVKGAINPSQPGTITWTNGPALTLGVFNGAMAAIDGGVFWLGGFDTLTTVTNQVWRYDIGTGVISQFTPSFPTTVARGNYMVARTLGHEIYVMAGDSGGDWYAPNQYYAKIGLTGSGIGAGHNVFAVRTSLQATPNPVHGLVRISYSLSRAEGVNLAIYDVTGKLVRTLVHGQVGSGTQSVTWDRTSNLGRRVAGGIYFYRLTTRDQSQGGKLVVTD